MKTMMEVDLPVIVQLVDYHDADFFLGDLERIGVRSIKAKELGFRDGFYSFVLYTGKLSDPETRKLIKEERAAIKEYDSIMEDEGF
jgi:hypothetical protein